MKVVYQICWMVIGLLLLGCGPAQEKDFLDKGDLPKVKKLTVQQKELAMQLFASLDRPEDVIAVMVADRSPGAGRNMDGYFIMDLQNNCAAKVQRSAQWILGNRCPIFWEERKSESGFNKVTYTSKFQANTTNARRQSYLAQRIFEAKIVRKTESGRDIVQQQVKGSMTIGVQEFNFYQEVITTVDSFSEEIDYTIGVYTKSDHFKLSARRVLRGKMTESYSVTLNRDSFDGMAQLPKVVISR